MTEEEEAPTPLKDSAYHQSAIENQHSTISNRQSEQRKPKSWERVGDKDWNDEVMNSKEINVGSVVRLKSGGPKMSVEEFKWNPTTGRYEEDIVMCCWFVGDEKSSSQFDRRTLEIAD